MKLKIEVNDNLTSIFNFIQDSREIITFHDLVQFCIDFECYKELYLNQDIIYKLLVERNDIIENEILKKKDVEV